MSLNFCFCPASNWFNRSRHAFSSLPPFSPKFLQATIIDSGIINGSSDQFKVDLTSAISSAPSGAPWHAAVPPLFGEPKPICVLNAKKDGLEDALASEITDLIA